MISDAQNEDEVRFGSSHGKPSMGCEVAKQYWKDGVLSWNA